MYKLSPSDFAYLYEDCKYCYYQKVKNGISHSGVFPAMFGRINSLLQSSIMGMNLKDIHPDLPSAIVEIQEGYIQSITVPGSKCYISGRFDILSRLEDGSYALIDFKITTPEEDKIQKYASQLNAYKFSLENPQKDKPKKIAKLGVVSINPVDMKLKKGKIVFTNQPTWHPIKEDSNSFLKLIGDISKLLEGDVPEPSATCNLCIYRSTLTSDSLQEPLPF